MSHQTERVRQLRSQFDHERSAMTLTNFQSGLPILRYCYYHLHKKRGRSIR
jgi:hypothetical protein